TDRRRRMTEYTKDILPVVEPRWRRPLWAGRRSSLTPGSESVVGARARMPGAAWGPRTAGNRRSTSDTRGASIPQVSGGLEGLAKAAGGAEGPFKRRGHRFKGGLRGGSRG